MKAILVSLALLLASGIAFGQSVYSVQMTNGTTFGFGSNFDQEFYISVDNRGNSYVAGLYHQYIPDTVMVLHPALTILSPTGETLHTLVDTVGNNNGGSFFVAKRSNGAYWDAWDTTNCVMSVDSNGKILWRLNMPGYYYGSSFNDTLIMVQEGNGTSPISSVFLIDTNGTIVKAFPIKVATSTIRSIVVQNGMVYMASQCDGGSLTSASGYVCAFDLYTGKVEWERTFDNMIRIFCDAGDSLVYMSGTSYVGHSAQAFNLAYLRKSDGAITWQKTWEPKETNLSNANNWVNGVAYDPIKKQVLVVGAIQRGEAQNDGLQSSYAYCFNANGDSLWNLEFDYAQGTTISQFTACTSYDGSFITIGYTNSWNDRMVGQPIVPNVGYFRIYSTLTPVIEPPSVPRTFALSQNYPNPFNPTTTIEYSLPQRMNVNLTVYNVLGEKVTTLVNGMEGPGQHQVIFDGSSLASGTYLYVLEASTYRSVQKMMLIK